MPRQGSAWSTPGEVLDATRWKSHEWRAERQERDDKCKFASCPHCDRSMPKGRRRCTRRTCPGYSGLWAGDHRIRFFRNLELYAAGPWPVDREARVWMGDVTAPGRSPESPVQAAALADLGLSGLSGHRSIRVWNASAGYEWSRLHRAAQQAVFRKSGRRARLLGYVWEQQGRGASHLHFLLGYTLAWECETARLYVRELDRLRQRYRFGFVDRKRNVKSAGQGAAYLSDYLLTGKGSKASVRESVASRELPHVPVYVAHDLIARTGVSMRSLRLVRFFWARFGSHWVQLFRDLGIWFQDAYAAWQMGGWAFVSVLIRAGFAAHAPP